MKKVTMKVAGILAVVMMMGSTAAFAGADILFDCKASIVDKTDSGESQQRVVTASDISLVNFRQSITKGPVDAAEYRCDSKDGRVQGVIVSLNGDMLVQEQSVLKIKR